MRCGPRDGLCPLQGPQLLFLELLLLLLLLLEPLLLLLPALGLRLVDLHRRRELRAGVPLAYLPIPFSQKAVQKPRDGPGDREKQGHEHPHHGHELGAQLELLRPRHDGLGQNFTKKQDHCYTVVCACGVEACGGEEQVGGWMNGWVDGYMGGWMVG